MRAALASFFLMGAAAAHAMPGFVDGGRGSTLGNISSAGVAGAAHNPAAGALQLDARQSYRGAYWNLFAFGLEAGPVDGFVERIEDLEGCLEEVVEEICRSADGRTLRPVGDDSIQLDEAEALQQEFNALLAEIGERAYLNLGLQLNLPGMPLVTRRGSGFWGVDLHASGNARVTVLDDPLRYNAFSQDIDTNTAVYLKTARFLRLGLSYARPLKEEFDRWLPGYTRGEFYGGVRLSVLQGTLAKVITAIDGEDSTGESAFERAEDSYEDAEESSTNVALDLGLMWRYQQVEAGLTLRNINSPSFDYGPIGVDCGAPGLSEGARFDCLVAASFSDRIAQRESFEMNPQATAEASWLLANGQARLSASVDLNPANSPTGVEYQWMVLGLAYTPRTWWAPGLRLGYRSNLGEDGIDSIALGLTLFGVLNIDVSQSSDTVIIDGDKYPRAASVSLGFEMPL